MKEPQLKQITKIIKAVADENRIRIICLLKLKKELCVCELTKLIGLAQPTISSHLKLLENAGLVESYKDGLWVNYSIADNLSIFGRQLIDTLCINLADDRQIKTDKEKSKKVSREIICKK